MSNMCYASISAHVSTFVVLAQSTLPPSYLVQLSSIVSLQWHGNCLRLRTWTFYCIGLTTPEVLDIDNYGVLRIQGDGSVGCGERRPGGGRQEDCL